MRQIADAHVGAQLQIEIASGSGQYGSAVDACQPQLGQRLAGAVDEAEEVALLKNLKPCTSAITDTAPAVDARIRPPSAKHTSSEPPLMWNN